MKVYEFFTKTYESFRNYLFGDLILKENEKIKGEIEQRKQRLESLAKRLSQQDEILEDIGYDYRKFINFEPANRLEEKSRI